MSVFSASHSGGASNIWTSSFPGYLVTPVNAATENVAPMLPDTGRNYGFVRIVGLPIKVLEDDPYHYRIEFDTKLLGTKKGKRPVFVYEASGKILCPEFNLSDYLYLKKHHLLFERLKTDVAETFPQLHVDKICWAYSPLKKGEDLDPGDVEFKDAAGNAFANFVRSYEPLLGNAKEAIRKSFDVLDSLVSDIILKHREDLACELNLLKRYGVYDRRHTSDILDILFGKRWSFFHGEDVLIDKETGTLLIPNFWVRYIEGVPTGGSSKNNPMAFVGYGMRAGIIEFGFDPYPWALLRVNIISNTIENAILEKTAFGEAKKRLHKAIERNEFKQHVRNRLVHIVGFRDGKMRLKKLSEEYIRGIDLEDNDKVEIITNLALGQLEAEAQEGEAQEGEAKHERSN